MLAIWVVVAVPMLARSQDSEIATVSALSDDESEFFETKIRPVLVEHCYSCHSADSKIVRGGLLVDSRESLRMGGDSGPSVVPGDEEQSLILAALRHESYEMPPDQKLPDSVIADFETWVRRGAFDPRDGDGQAGLPRVDWDAARSHWAFQPLGNPQPPVVDDAGWSTNPIDRFIFKELDGAGMRPAEPADKRTLIRRATFDLIGLPPTVQEIEAFLADDSPAAFARVVDRLLDSPHYGQRWGRHWLDTVRYADTNGADENHALPQAWRYRDWVVRMFNRDLPFDQFVLHQLAGDLLPEPGDEEAAGDLLTATGMLVIGPKMLAEQDKDKMVIDIVDEQIDTVTRTLLGLTVACARCHDHKFDPISAEDYYSLAGIFYSTRTMADRAFVSNWLERPLPSAEITARRHEHQQRIDAAAEQLKQAEQKLAAAEKESAAADRRSKRADRAVARAAQREAGRAKANEQQADAGSTVAEASPQVEVVAVVATADADGAAPDDSPPSEDASDDAEQAPVAQVDLDALKAVVASRKEEVEKLTKELPEFVMVMAADEGEMKSLPVSYPPSVCRDGKTSTPMN